MGPIKVLFASSGEAYCDEVVFLAEDGAVRLYGSSPYVQWTSWAWLIKPVQVETLIEIGVLQRIEIQTGRSGVQVVIPCGYVRSIISINLQRFEVVIQPIAVPCLTSSKPSARSYPPPPRGSQNRCHGSTPTNTLRQSRITR